MSLNVAGSVYGIKKSLLTQVAKEVFLYLGKDLDVNLKFVSAGKIQELNRIYRHKDQVTNVLSFDLENGGDVVINLSEAKKNAKDWKMNLDETVALLLAHGILHLAGFEHTKPQDRAKMEKAEQEILAKAGISINR